MSYFDCNAPGTTGYSMVTDGIDILMINAHIQGNNPAYEDVHQSFRWVYIPVDDGELLTEISTWSGYYGGGDMFDTMVSCIFAVK